MGVALGDEDATETLGIWEASEVGLLPLGKEGEGADEGLSRPAAVLGNVVGDPVGEVEGELENVAAAAAAASPPPPPMGVIVGRAPVAVGVFPNPAWEGESVVE